MNINTFWDNWIHGWSIVREIDHLQPIENGYCFSLNDGKRELEWLLFSPDNLAETLPKVSNRDYFCISGIDEHFIVPQGWYSNMTADMMICENLPQQAVTLPENFTIESNERENRVVLKVFNAEQQRVCQGQAGFYNGFIVYDSIATEPPFRRQGFGTLIMALLTEKAVKRGISKGLLCASEMGKPLYLSLGWKSLGQYVRVVREDYTRES
ncbi:hypothetical protein A1D29_03215 [Pasteurellaceae bacterium Orientalotternb1]|nr:hypothetical protein A1D29_03215 [Pasteurellaceae bacterium Orientalotternb1]